MKLLIGWIKSTGSTGSAATGGPTESCDRLATLYVGRIAQFAETEAKAFRSEQAFWEAIEKLRGRTAPLVVLLDGRGKTFSSGNFAAWIGRQRDAGTQTIVLAIGPADGWAEPSRHQAGLLLSLGPMTLPHELARVLLAEQVYRAFTILAGHPYHRE